MPRKRDTHTILKAKHFINFNLEAYLFNELYIYIYMQNNHVILYVINYVKAHLCIQGFA